MVCEPIINDECANCIALGGQNLLDVGDAVLVLIFTLECETFNLPNLGSGGDVELVDVMRRPSRFGWFFSSISIKK